MFSADRPLTTFDDAVQLLAVMERALPDAELLRGDGPAEATEPRDDLRAVVDSGPDADDASAGDQILDGVDLFLERLSTSDCTISG